MKNWLRLHKASGKLNRISLAAGVILILLLTSYSCSESKKTIQVLFVGNSYTYRNNMPMLFEEIARSKGEQVSVTHVTRGKYTFYLQSKRKKLRRALNKHWDVIVLQGSSRDMLRDSLRFKKRTYPALDRMLAMIQQKQKDARVYFYMTWPYKKGDRKDQRFSDPDSMLRAVANGYSNLRNRYNIPVIPVGKVWRKYTRAYPDSDLYIRDNSHPSYAGSYLVACTMYSAIFGKSPVGADDLAITHKEEYSRIQQFIGKQYRTKDFQSFLEDSN